MEEITETEWQLPTAKEIRDDTSLEEEKRKPKVFLIYGHHSINEAIAKTIAPRMKNSRVALRTDLSLIEQPRGLCYVDAYFAAKQKADPRSAEFSNVYTQEVAKRLRRGYERSFEVACQNPDATVIDIHEMPAGLYEEEGIYVNVPDCDNQCLARLKEQLRGVLPSGRESSFLVYVAPSGVFQSGELKVLRRPHNYVILELVTNPDLYEKLAEADKAWVDYHSRTSEVRQLRAEREDLELKKRIDHERTKYARILEVVIPVVAEFMGEKRQGQKVGQQAQGE